MTTIPGGAGSARWTGLLSLLALLVVLAACSRAPVKVEATPATAAVTPAGDDSLRWWYARFRFQRPADGVVNSYLDLLVADRLLAGIVAEYQPHLAAWRFHRRWADDATGHQFSLVFRAPSAVAETLSARIAAHPLLATLDEQGYLLSYRLQAAPAVRALDPGGTSDPSWPSAVQREWPQFIMGASRMWLGLVQDAATGADADDIHLRYQAAETAVEALWFEHANHALFHHLSALFGYAPTRIIRREIMTF